MVVTPNHQLWAADAHGRVKVFLVSTAEPLFSLVKSLATISTSAHAVLVRTKHIRLSSMLFLGITNSRFSTCLARPCDLLNSAALLRMFTGQFSVEEVNRFKLSKIQVPSTEGSGVCVPSEAVDRTSANPHHHNVFKNAMRSRLSCA
jgi:hypothetical protein